MGLPEPECLLGSTGVDSSVRTPVAKMRVLSELLPLLILPLLLAPGAPGLDRAAAAAAAAAVAPAPALDESCLSCLCQAATGCDADRECDGNTCGMFAISRQFWRDAGEPGGGEL